VVVEAAPSTAFEMSEPDLLLEFLIVISDGTGRVKYSTALVTSLAVTKANIADIVAAGRSRWKIENETFNVMKNHGYELVIVGRDKR
jgi:hypothetical protein